MNETVLVTGGTGSIGQRLTQRLQQAGYQVSLLSRSPHTLPNVRVFAWNVDKGEIDSQAVTTADYIIHLAGAGIADERWTDARKQEILESRTRSAELITDVLKSSNHHVKAFVSASAIGYYGGDTDGRPLVETSPAGTDFLAQVTRAWERAADGVAALGIRTVKLRTGVVFTMAGGALPKLVQPIRLGAGVALGSGQQYISWIHIDDLCQMFMQALTDTRWRGAYNAVAPTAVTNADLTKQIASVLDKPLFLPNVPAFALKLLFGELAITVLGSTLVLNKRIQDETDFTYRFANLRYALADLLA